MNSLNKLKINSLVSFVYQFLTIAIGLVLPRFILKAYGSEVNGLQASIGQFLSIINFLELGVGSVVQSALYRPLAEKDYSKISELLSAAQSFFNKLAAILILYVIILLLIFPKVVNSPLDFYSTSFLILSMSMGLFAQFYFGITNQLLLNADQLNYVQISVQIITIILNAIFTVILIILGFSIVFVKFITGLIFLIRPLFLSYYVKKNYTINTNQPFTANSIPQKWNGMAQHISFVVFESTDITVLSLASSLQNVSIYTVYNFVISGMKMLILSLTGGLKSFFGFILARDDIETANLHFSRIEWLLHNLIIYIFAMIASLIVPFVMLYTRGITDVNYRQPLFSFILVLAQMIYCIRSPYHTIVLSAGHYKQTQTSSVIEALLNLIISICAVNFFGLIGVALGTLIAAFYRTIYLARYLSNNILFRDFKVFIKQILIDILIFSTIIALNFIIKFSVYDYLTWIIYAIILGVGGLVCMLLINIIFYNEMIMNEVQKLKRKF